MKATRARRLDAFAYDIYHYGRHVGLAEQVKPRKWLATPKSADVEPETFSAKRSAEAWLARVHEGKRLPAESACGWE